MTRARIQGGEIKSVTASEIRQEFSDTLNRVIYREETVLIERHGLPVAALISFKAFSMFQNIMEKIEEHLDAQSIGATVKEELLDFDVVVKGH